MGRLENGKWIDQWHNTKETKGRYVRSHQFIEIG